MNDQNPISALIGTNRFILTSPTCKKFKKYHNFSILFGESLYQPFAPQAKGLSLLLLSTKHQINNKTHVVQHTKKEKKKS